MECPQAGRLIPPATGWSFTYRQPNPKCRREKSKWTSAQASNRTTRAEKRSRLRRTYLELLHHAMVPLKARHGVDVCLERTFQPSATSPRNSVCILHANCASLSLGCFLRGGLSAHDEQHESAPS